VIDPGTFFVIGVGRSYMRCPKLPDYITAQLQHAHHYDTSVEALRFADKLREWGTHGKKPIRVFRVEVAEIDKRGEVA